MSPSAQSQSSNSQRLVVPSARHLAWHQDPYYAFVHFGPNTFAGVEWGSGKEDPKVFNPTQFDARQWCKVFRDAGMTGVIITAKHHDGFCLWPSKFSKHTVRESGWKNGTGDVLKELSAACREFGLKFGVYLSPWDRNHPDYGTQKYNKVFADMLKEVLTSYGPVFEVWFDGANGEGPNGKRQVYDWPLFHRTVRKFAPRAVIFSDAGPDIRWVGNEAGYAGETNWATIDSSRYEVATPLYEELQFGQENGDVWRPAECDVSIRPGWFYHPDQDAKVKTREKLIDIYLGSVGRGANLLLNVPPDRRGLIHENDIKALNALAQWRTETFKLAPQLKLRNPKSSQSSPSHREMELSFESAQRFDLVQLRERIKAGQRVRSFQIEAKVNDKWERIAIGTTIGVCRLVKFPLIETTELRITMDGNREIPADHVTVSAHLTPDSAQSETKADRDRRMSWWREARFGMFIHWGLYSIPAGQWKGKTYSGASEWLIYHAGIPHTEWMPLQQQFNPTKFDALQVAQLAKDAGMKYLVITSKHHEGFCLWDTETSTFDVMGSPFKRDILSELKLACDKVGVKLCFYYSILDWTHPDYLPRAGWDSRPAADANFERYRSTMKAQLTELVNRFKPAVLWFDGEWDASWTPEFGRELYAYLRSLDPALIINNRIGKGRDGMAGFDEGLGAVGDFGTPEQEIPNSGRNGIDWESCMTFNDSWGFHASDTNWKSAATLIHNLISCTSKGGNYLLNIGPDSLGRVPEASTTRLQTVGKWLKTYGESIYGAGAATGAPKQSWGYITHKPGVLYCHVVDPNASSFVLRGFKGQIKKVSDLGNESEASLMFGMTPEGPTLPIPHQQPANSDLQSLPRVIIVEYQGPLSFEEVAIAARNDGSYLLAANDATISGKSAKFESANDKNCIGFWTNASDSVSWDIHVEQPGEYEVTITYANDPANGTSHGQIECHGAILTFAAPPTKAWSDFVKLPSGKLAIVSAGRHTIKVSPKKMGSQAFLNLRLIELKRIP